MEKINHEAEDIRSTYPIKPPEGWYALHQLYEIDSNAWQAQSLEEQKRRREAFIQHVIQFRKEPDCQLLFFSVIGRADFGFLALSPDLHMLDICEKRIHVELGPGVLKRHTSFFSVTEESEYRTTDEEYATLLQRDEGLHLGTPEFEAKLKGIQERNAQYTYQRIYPKVEGFQTLCFYPMAKRRDAAQNWYALPYAERRRLMAGHAAVGRAYGGKVKQMITGATGLSDWEWGVTLFAQEPSLFKSIVYQMRFDEVSHQYGVFGPFYIGIILEPEKLLKRVLG